MIGRKGINPRINQHACRWNAKQFGKLYTNRARAACPRFRANVHTWIPCLQQHARRRFYRVSCPSDRCGNIELFLRDDRRLNILLSKNLFWERDGYWPTGRGGGYFDRPPRDVRYEG